MKIRRCRQGKYHKSAENTKWLFQFLQVGFYLYVHRGAVHLQEKPKITCGRGIRTSSYAPSGTVNELYRTLGCRCRFSTALSSFIRPHWPYRPYLSNRQQQGGLFISIWPWRLPQRFRHRPMPVRNHLVRTFLVLWPVGLCWLGRGCKESMASVVSLIVLGLG